MLFGRNPRTRLPSVAEVDDHQHDSPTSCSSQRDSCAQQAKTRDAIAKQKQKQYADKRNRARTRELAVGDRVVVRDDKSGNKLSPAFHPTPMLVVARKGNMITADSSNRRVTRNVSYFKKIFFDDPSWAADDDDLDDDVGEIYPSPTPMPPSNHTGRPKPPAPGRPRRHHRPPSYLKDYVTTSRQWLKKTIQVVTGRLAWSLNLCAQVY